MVSREVSRHSGGVTTFSVNGRKCMQKEVVSLLKAKGLDLQNNRFLILQGEVEQIAMMKPKASVSQKNRCLSLCLSLSVCVSLSVSLSLLLSLCVSLSVSLSLCLSLSLSLSLSVSLPPLSLSVTVSLSRCLCLFVSLWICLLLLFRVRSFCLVIFIAR